MANRNNIILPDDIVLFQILPRLPNKSLGRFMCVCKQWHSFLISPVFTKIHVSNQNQHKLVVVSNTKPCNYFCTIDCETPELGLSANRPLPFEVGSNWMSIISSLNGLVCVGIKPLPVSGGFKCNFLNIVLWNPLTGDYKTLSKANNCFSIPPRAYGLYYTSCDDDYKLLGVTQSSDAYIYSWKSDSWQKAKSRVDSLLKNWGFGWLLNGKLYFLAKGTQGGNGSEISRSLIISFDTKTEMFREIAPPSSSSCLHMMVEGGCIHLWAYDPLELWKLDGDGEWTKVIWRLPKVHLIKDGYRLLPSFGQVCVFKDEGNKSKKVCEYTIDDTMLFLQNGKFVETIVSLKRLWMHPRF